MAEKCLTKFLDKARNAKNSDTYLTLETAESVS